MRGADVLEEVVRFGYRDGLADRARGVSITYVARRLTGVGDGRKIMGQLRKLVTAQLITMERIGDTTFARPTERGIEVDDTLARITAARGGEFRPWSNTDLTITEKLALHA